MNGPFLLALWVCASACFRNGSTSLTSAHESPKAIVLKAETGELRLTEPCSSSGALGDSTFPSKRQRSVDSLSTEGRLKNALPPHQSSEPPAEEAEESHRKRILPAWERLLKSKSDPTLSRQDERAALTLLEIGYDTTWRFLAKEDATKGTDPEEAGSQGTTAASKSHHVTKKPPQVGPHVEETVGWLKSSVSRNRENEIDRYLHLASLSSKDHQKVQLVQILHMNLLGQQDSPQSIEVIGNSAGRFFQIPSTFLEPIEADLRAIAHYYLHMVKDKKTECFSARAFATALLKRWGHGPFFPKTLEKKKKRLFNNQLKEIKHFGLNLEVKDFGAFQSYIKKPHRGMWLPYFGAWGKTTYSRFINEISVRCGLKRVAIMQLVPQVEKSFAEVESAVEARLLSSGRRWPRRLEAWMKFTKRCTYMTINYIVLLEYVTTPFKIENVRKVREEASSFLQQSKDVWTSFFNLMHEPKSRRITQTFLLKPKDAQQIVLTQRSFPVRGQESRWSSALFLGWYTKTSPITLMDSHKSGSKERNNGLCRFLDDCTFVEWIGENHEA